MSDELCLWRNVIIQGWNKFPASTGQDIQSNPFLLGHSLFLAGQVSIVSFFYKNPFPHWTRTFTVLKLYVIFEVSGGKVEHTTKPQHLAK